MKSVMVVLAVLAFSSTLLVAQSSIVERFQNDEALQDSIIAVMVPQHKLMSKLIKEVQKNPSLHKMLVQHLARLLNENQGTNEPQEHEHESMMSPYSGDQKREIKALSATEVKGLMEGEGLGYAMAAELNHYPGPKHILDMGEKLNLSAAQRKAVEWSYDTMHSRAVTVGVKLIDRERTLDKAFAASTVTVPTLQRLTTEIEKLRGELRSVHLAAHIETRAILSPEQIAAYDRMRGY